MRALPLFLLMSAGCVLDRTGQSASYAYERELAVQKSRAEELERVNDELERRLSQLEEVTRYRGQQEAAKMENLDQVRVEVQRLRGEVELARHDRETGGQEAEAFRQDAEFRTTYLEARVAELEKALGLTPPPPPESGTKGAAVVEGGASGPTVSGEGEVKLPEGEPQEVGSASGPDELLALAEENLRDGKPKVARAVLERFIRENPDHERLLEAKYRLAESYFNEGEYQQAVLRFEDVVQGGGTSPWVAWSMVRQGECFKAMGKDAEAQIFWEDVVARFPRSKAAKEAKEFLGR